MKPGELALKKQDSYPVFPDNDYRWEKLCFERVALAYGRRYGMKIRIARFQNYFGPERTWRGGREKAPSAICRKVAGAKLKGLDEIDVLGDGIAILYLIKAVYILMQSELKKPINVGTQDYISIEELVDLACEIAEKKAKKWVPRPIRVKLRNFF